MGLLISGIAFGGFDMPSTRWLTAIGVFGAANLGIWCQRLFSDRARSARLRQANRSASPLATALAPQLLGDYSPYVIEAAEKLGEARDASAIPTLLCVLEQCVDRQRPGWREIAETLVKTLMQIGDRRALPLLYRLENVRGIGFIPAVRSAIAAIEPQTSLLRPGCAADRASETLLRPAHADNSAHDAAALLRAADSGKASKEGNRQFAVGERPALQDHTLLG